MPTNRPDFTTWVDDVAPAEFEGRGHWTSQTWMDVFLASVKQQPSALCVADEQAALTRAQVLACARRLARRMASRGVGAGDVVRVAVPNWREFVVIHAAIVGYPDIRLGERCSFLRQRGVAKFKLPERLCLLDALPMTETGKVRKAELRALVNGAQPKPRRRRDPHVKQGYGIQDEASDSPQAMDSEDLDGRIPVTADLGADALSSPQLQRNDPLGNQIADTLRREILLGRLPSGTRVSQQQLCERFGTSRMPVRDALRELVHEGLMTLDSARHIVVAPLSKEDLLDAFTIEGVLTGMAAERASQRASEADLEALDRLHHAMLDAAEQMRQGAMVELNWSFHRKVNHMSGSRKLIVALRKVSVDLPRDFLEQVPEWNTNSNADHARILAAMRAKKHKTAGKYMTEHVMESGRGLVEHLAAHGVQFD